MKKSGLTPRGRVVLAVCVQIALVLIVFLLRRAWGMPGRAALVALCDGFFIGGVLYLFWALISWGASRGGLDGFFYLCRIIANMLSSDALLQGRPRHISFYDFTKSREHEPSHAKLFILIGLVSIVLSAVLYVILRAG